MSLSSPDALDSEALDQEIDAADIAGDDKTARLLKQARQEAATRRVANRELTQKLAQAQADIEVLNAKLTETGDRSSQAQAQVEAAQKQLQETLDRLDAANQTVIASLPERLRPVVPPGLDAVALRTWLDTAVPLLSVAPAPLEGGAGSPGSRGDSTPVSPDVAELALALRIDPQELAKRTRDGDKRV